MNVPCPCRRRRRRADRHVVRRWRSRCRAVAPAPAQDRRPSVCSTPDTTVTSHMWKQSRDAYKRRYAVELSISFVEGKIEWRKLYALHLSPGRLLETLWLQLVFIKSDRFTGGYHFKQRQFGKFYCIFARLEECRNRWKLTPGNIGTVTLQDGGPDQTMPRYYIITSRHGDSMLTSLTSRCFISTATTTLTRTNCAMSTKTTKKTGAMIGETQLSSSQSSMSSRQHSRSVSWNTSNWHNVMLLLE